MSHTLVPPHHPVLNAVAETVPVDQIQTEEIQSLIDEMTAIAKGERADVSRRVMVGLAAPQIGISKQIILVDVDVGASRLNLGKMQAYINPSIIWQSTEQEMGREGCFSADRLQGIVPRSVKIRITAYDRTGQFVIEELTGFTARIFQHEFDHLNGVRFPDRLGENGRLLWVEEEEYDLYRQTWQNWQKTVPFSKWIEMKMRPYDGTGAD